MEESLYHTEGGVTVHRAIDRLDVPHQRAIDPLVEALDSRQGAVLTRHGDVDDRRRRGASCACPPHGRAGARGRVGGAQGTKRPHARDRRPR